ncbi:MAG: MBL fold metallo-hydrolase [Gemmatimonadales bacterium]|nr:MBL fold metallo-hydrolase [Gemmatimonadales bacterium]
MSGEARAAHLRPGGGFRNPWPGGEATPPSRLPAWWWERLRHPAPADPPASAFPIAEPAFDAPRAAAGVLTLTWVGHSSFLVQLGPVNVLLDPVWSARASPLAWLGPRRRVPAVPPLDALPPIDAVLLSHDHYDHWDAPTLRRLARDHPAARWVVPLGLADAARALGAGAVHVLDWWDEATLPLGAGALEVVAVPAQHFSGRTPFDRDATLWCGYLLRAHGRALWFAGDTGYHPDFGAIGARARTLDAALIPVGAYDPRWFMRPVHVDPEEAVRAWADCRAGLAADAPPPCFVPMHWGTFRLTDEPLDEPPRRARAAWQAAGLPDASFAPLRHGETLRVPR